MGNEGNRPNSASDGQKIILRLRNREILLHYAFKMKLMISDIALFPHELEGLRLWDSDIVLARFAILESERFRGKDVVVLKAGVGVAGIALKKWTDCKEVVMCDTRDEVVNNMSKNCEKNGVRGLNCCKIDFKDLGKTAAEFDCLLCADILNNGLPPQLILEIFRKLLKDGGEAIIVMPERKELARRFLEQVDRKEFKIVNLILTAEEYEASPLFNKLEGASEFPLLTSNFYAISLTRVKINREKGQEERKNIIQLKPVVEEEKEREKESENKERINGRAAIREASFIPK